VLPLVSTPSRLASLTLGSGLPFKISRNLSSSASSVSQTRTQVLPKPRASATIVTPVGLAGTRTLLAHCLVESAVVHESIVEWAPDRLSAARKTRCRSGRTGLQNLLIPAHSRNVFYTPLRCVISTQLEASGTEDFGTRL
jgi:hypothetical protein